LSGNNLFYDPKIINGENLKPFFFMARDYHKFGIFILLYITLYTR